VLTDNGMYDRMSIWKLKEVTMNFRTLRADEIDIRVQQCKATGCALLLYKNSRVDMQILDESVGTTGWQRKHLRDNQNCIVSIWDGAKNQWIEKEDTGSESNTEKEKGLASDSFKRSCVNWGIGRELYSSPFIWIKLDASEVKANNGRHNLGFGVSFHIDTIEYSEDRKITKLIIKDSKGKVRYTMPTIATAIKPKPKPVKKLSQDKVDNIKTLFADKKIPQKVIDTTLKDRYGVSTVEELSEVNADKLMANLSK